MDKVSASGGIQAAVQAVKQAVNQEASVVKLIQQAQPNPPLAKTALDIQPPDPDTGRGQVVDIRA